MDSEGLNVRRLTTVGNWNDAAAWNPSKEYSEIAYTSRLEAAASTSPSSTSRRARSGRSPQGRGSCEYPSWAPNGRHLVFSCKRGRQLADHRRRPRGPRSSDTLAAGPGNNVQPDWGP